ncbi:MAG: LysM peptidoglycan-binding domain-containing protein [Actinomycetota bacterium]|nr:LysM peptidoglycan-binding domain-containing protein [Actinomycetota bacterium]
MVGATGGVDLRNNAAPAGNPNTAASTTTPTAATSSSAGSSSTVASAPVATDGSGAQSSAADGSGYSYPTDPSASGNFGGSDGVNPTAFSLFPQAFGAPAGSGSYTVQQGDTLFKIAQAQGISGGWVALYSANMNTIADPNSLYPGEQISLY